MKAKVSPEMRDAVLAQVALNTNNMSGSLRFYSEVLGFRNAGANAFWGDVAVVQGLSRDASAIMWWMVGKRPFFQFEFFSHGSPKQKPQPKDWRPSDHGWVRFGIAVKDFDRTLAGLERHRVPITGATGGSRQRRLAFHDPFAGTVVEVMERDAGPLPTVVYAACSVADLGKARRLYEEVMGAEILPLNGLHQPADEALWGLAGAERDGFLVRLGDAFLEILKYEIGRPRAADHCIADQGMMNVGIGNRDIGAIRRLIARIREAQARITVAFDSEESAGTYVIEPDFEIELMGVQAFQDAKYGFAPVPFVNEFGLEDTDA